MIRLLAFCILLSSCSVKNFGLYVSKIQGSVTYIDKSFDEVSTKGFVLAVLRNKSFVTFGDNVLDSKSIIILNPDSTGSYEFRPGMAFSRVDFYVIFEKYTVDHQAIAQKIGTRSVTLSSTLSENKDWQNYYYFSLKPFLSSIINDKSYRASDVQMQQIFDFLTYIESKF